MNRDQVLETLREHEPELKATGVVSLSLFGFTARGETNPPMLMWRCGWQTTFPATGSTISINWSSFKDGYPSCWAARSMWCRNLCEKTVSKREIDRDRALAL